jgi:hypothetical protein
MGMYCGKLAEREIAGLLVESLAIGMMTEAALLPFPVIVLQGFGMLPPALSSWVC